MDREHGDTADPDTERDESRGVDAGKKPWIEPRLAFVEPKLTEHGELTKVTGQFFGAFSVGEDD